MRGGRGGVQNEKRGGGKMTRMRGGRERGVKE
jgi:hypothetical protein